VKLVVPVDGGDEIAFEYDGSFVSNWVCADILRGKTYPFLPFVPDVRVVFDAGANCGAATVHFARHYPDAEVHAFEPGSEQLGYLRTNVSTLPNVQVHPIGLHATDQELPLYRGDGDTGMASVFKRAVNLDQSELVQLRAAGPWAAEQGIERIDVLKVDVEGCEGPVIESLAPLLPNVKVLYLEYDSRRARRDIAALVEPTHELYIGKMFLDQGECVYLAKGLAELDAATETLQRLFVEALAGEAGDRRVG
jgi:FkbM family methyltransferase